MVNKVRAAFLALLLTLVGMLSAVSPASATEPPTGTWRMQNWWSNLCVSVNSTYPGAPVFQYWCPSSSAQYPGSAWTFEYIPSNGYYRVVSAYNTNYCLARHDPGNAVLRICGGGYEAQVTFHKLSNGAWQIQERFFVRCLGIWPEDGNAVGDGFVWRRCDSGSSTYFTFYLPLA